MPELLKKSPKLDSSKGVKKPNVLSPSWMRDMFEGIVDTGLGAIGVGPDTKSNRLGAMLGMMVPSAGKLGMGRYNTKLGASDFPVQSRLGMGMNPNKGIYDDAGRYLGQGNKVDPMYTAHVNSSVGKGDPRMVTKIEPVEESFINRGNTKTPLAPSAEQIEEMMKKFKK